MASNNHRGQSNNNATGATSSSAETTLTVQSAEDHGNGDDEPIVGQPRTFQQKAAAHNTTVAQYQVEEVIEIMKENVDKVLERDAKLGEMEERAEALFEGASAFQKSAGTLKNKAMWANLKQTIILVVLGLILLLIGAKYLDFI